MTILALNCATENLALALLKQDDSSIERFYHGQTIKAELLNLFIKELLQEGAIELTELTGLAVAIGPGAFTGLRLSLVTAKTLALALQIPLAAISTLEALAWQHRFRAEGQNLRIALAACRGELTTALFAPDMRRLEADHAIPAEELATICAAEQSCCLENPSTDALTLSRLAQLPGWAVKEQELLPLVPRYSHQSRVNKSSKPELQHLKIADNA